MAIPIATTARSFYSRRNGSGMRVCAHNAHNGVWVISFNSSWCSFAAVANRTSTEHFSIAIQDGESAADALTRLTPSYNWDASGNRLSTIVNGEKSAITAKPAAHGYSLEYRGWPFVVLSKITVTDLVERVDTTSYIRSGNFKLTIPSINGMPSDNYYVHVQGLVLPAVGTSISMVSAVICLRALRRVLRGRRGRCMVCGYSLRGFSAASCPECGSAVHRR